MALQGNLRDFAATEILQLLGSQKKSGCLALEWNTERAILWVADGRLVAARQPGMVKDDPLVAFLRRTHRLSDEQYQGLVTIQHESSRDLEDLLLNGRYFDAPELAECVERQILDELTRVVRWENGSYRFDPNTRWPNPPLVAMSIEGAMIEASRRFDEQKRFVSLFRDPHQLLGVRDLPDPDDPLSDEERELFGIVDGQHTIAQIVEAAPLTEYETYEALQHMLEVHWIEFTGRRDPSVTPPPSAPVAAARPQHGIVREVTVAIAAVALVAGLRFASGELGAHGAPAPRHDVFAAAQIRDLRYTLDLYRRERGSYPRRLEDLVEDRWIDRGQLRLPGYLLTYRVEDDGQNYRLDLSPDR